MLQILCSVRSTPALIPESVLFDFGIGNITKEASQLPMGLDEALLKISYRISVERLKTFASIYRSVIKLFTLSCLRFGHCL